MKKICIILFIAVFLLTYLTLPGYTYTQIPAYLCEMGIKFYQQGRYDDALHEFQKVLLIKPDYELALKYIKIIEQKGMPVEPVAPIYPTAKPVPAVTAVLEVTPAPEISLKPEVAPEKAPLPLYKMLRLDDTLKEILQPITIEQGKGIIITGKNIQRYLLTRPDIIDIKRKNADEILVTGKDIGYTYLHIWDDNGRWTTEWLGIFPTPEGPTYEELIRREEEKARNFKLRYTLGWSSFESGRRIDLLERSAYSWAHGLSLNGPTPYGDIDSAFNIRRLRTTTDLTYLTLGLSNGQIGPFKGFTLRTFDFYPYYYNLAFPSATLRGVMFTSPIFGKKFEYTTFWGREGGGRYGNLSPGLTKTKNSFLEGFNLDYSPSQKQNYKFSVLHGHGRDREETLNRYAYDLSGSYNFDKWGMDYEVAQDSERFAHLFKTHYNRKKFNLITELRNVDEHFTSITGTGWRQGELGGLFKLNYAPNEKLSTNASLDAYLSRLYPAEDDNDRLNEDLNWEAIYKIDDKTALNLNYSLLNDLGRISQSRYQVSGVGISRKFKLIRDISTFANYYHQENKNFSSPNIDYVNERIYAGLRFSLFSQLYYYLNKELNFLEARYTADHSMPQALETGLDWSEQIGKTPFYGTFRFTFRDEEDTVSNLSFLAGEDYIEGYTELSYRPNSDIELYGATRVRNAWQENPAVAKRIEASFNAGIRYLWDTGVRWESVGNIEGYVFKDLNSDGLREKDEPPVKDIKVWLGKDKSQVTDALGYYKFKGVKAKKAYITFDTATLPAGYLLTVLMTQEATIQHHRNVRIDFGIISRSEISGYIFEDVDGNGEYTAKDNGVQGVVITLEDGKKAVTDNQGRYVFTAPSAGKHTINIDLNSIPVYYLPQVTLSKEITLFEGVTYVYSVPLKKIKK